MKTLKEFSENMEQLNEWNKKQEFKSLKSATQFISGFNDEDNFRDFSLIKHRGGTGWVLRYTYEE